MRAKGKTTERSMDKISANLTPPVSDMADELNEKLGMTPTEIVREGIRLVYQSRMKGSLA